MFGNFTYSALIPQIPDYLIIKELPRNHLPFLVSLLATFGMFGKASFGYLSEFFTSRDNVQLDKKTLVALRWIALVGQYATISTVFFIFKFELPFIYCSLIIFAGVLSNLYLWY